MEPNITSPQEINTFLESLDLLSIGEEHNKALMADITKEERGGFPAEWYKTFKEQIVLTLLDCFNHILKEGEPPRT